VAPACDDLNDAGQGRVWQGPATMLRAQFGEKVGDYCFSPLRKVCFLENGIMQWYAPCRYVSPHETGFAALNLDDRAARYEGFEIPARQLALVAQPYETMAARLHLEQPGTYFVAVSFQPLLFKGAYLVAVSANGRRLWEFRLANAEEGAQFSGWLEVAAASFVDLAINAEKAGQEVACRCAVRFAVFRCDSITGDPVERLDNRISDLSGEEIKKLYAYRGPSPIAVPAGVFGLQERAAMLEAEWRLPPQYLRVGFNRSAIEVTEMIETNKGEAEINYCIFVVGRSGSTLLSEILAGTGKLGFAQEFFIPEIVRAFSLCYADRFASYEDFIKTKLKTDNGVFGIEIEGMRLLEEPDFFANTANWRYVYNWREDLLAQAISMMLATRTGVWHRFEHSVDDGVVDGLMTAERGGVMHWLNYLLGTERTFRDFFRDHGIEPLCLSYEELLADPAGQVERLAEHIGVPKLDLSELDLDGMILKRTGKAHNAFFAAMVMTGGGQFWGYDLLEIDGRHVGVLHGTDLSLISTEVERAPVLFLGGSRPQLCETVLGAIIDRVKKLP